MDQKERSTLIRRIIAGVTLFAFVVTSLVQNPASAYAGTSPASKNQVLPAQLQTVKLPSAFGKIEDIYQGTSKETVIVIQDAHAIPDAQKNIFRILRYFQTRYGVKLTGVEGANAALDPQIFKSFPDKKILKQIFGGYFNQGELTGSTASAIFTDGAEYRGVEDWKLYEQGLGLYLASLEKEPALNGKLGAWEKELEAKKGKTYSAELRGLDRQWQAFEENQGNLLEVIRALAKIQKPAEGSKVAAVLAESAERSPEEIAAEVEVLAEKVKTGLKEDTAAFNQQYQLFRTSQITAHAFALFIKRAAHKHHIPVKISPALLGGMKNQSTVQQLEGTQFFAELENYAQAVKESLMSGEEQKALDRESRALLLAKKLTRLELSRKEWNEVKSYVERSTSNGEEIKSFKEFKIQNAFYENAEKRDQAFLENIEKIWNERRAAYDVRGTLLIAGGFHAQGLTRRLKEKNISYLLVMPRIKEIPKETNYRAHMQGEVSWKKYFREENGKINLYQAFVRGTRDRLLAAPPAEEERTALKNWRDQIIRDLAEKKQIDKAGDYTRFLDEVVSGNSQSKLTGKISEGFQKVNQFLSGLRKLESQKQMTDQNIANLLRVGSAAEMATYSALNPSVEATSYARLAENVIEESVSSPEKIESAPRAEIRSAGSPDEQKRITQRELTDILKSPTLTLADFDIRVETLMAQIPGIRGMTLNAGGTEATTVGDAFDRRRQELVEKENKIPKNYLNSGIDMERTVPANIAELSSGMSANEFVNQSAAIGKRSPEEMLKDLDDEVASEHERMRRQYGFLPRSHSKEIEAVYKMFEKLIEAYNQIAHDEGQPYYEGKLFIVDSPEVNAFVYAEHQDVYIHMGLIRELAQYAKVNKEPFTLKIVGSILGHELTHVLQHSSYEGLAWPNIADEQKKNAEIQVVLRAKRNAEFHADQGSIRIMSRAGYTPREIVRVLKFLERITPQSTAEQTISTHPHPKWRSAVLGILISSDDYVTSNWGLEAKEIKPEVYHDLPTGHIHHVAEKLANYSEIMNEANRIVQRDREESPLIKIRKIFELTRLLKENRRLATVKAYAESSEADRSFALWIYQQNILTAIRAVLARAKKENNPVLTPSPSPLGAYIANRITDKPQIEPQSLKTNLSGIETRGEENFSKKIASLITDVNASGLDIQTQQKMTALIKALTEDYQNQKTKINPRQFLNAMAKEPPSFDDQTEMLMRDEIPPAAFRSLREIPFSVLLSFGKKTLDRSHDVSISPFSDKNKSERKVTVHSEIESSEFYRQDVRKLSIDTPDRRRYVLNVARYNWMDQALKDSYGVDSGLRWRESMKDFRDHFLQFILDNAPDLDPALVPGSDYQEKNEKAKNLLRKAFEAGELNVASSEFEHTLEYLSFVLPESPEIRSSIYQSENGLSPLPPAVRLSFYKETRQNSYFEIIDNADDPAKILSRALEAATSQPEIAKILASHLGKYTKYFRKKILLKTEGLMKIPLPYRYPGDLFKAVASLTSGADAYEFITEHMKKISLLKPEGKAAPSPQEYKTYLEKFIDFYEGTYLPQRNPSGKMLDGALIERYFQAHALLLEQEGRMPTPEMAAQQLALISQYGLLELSEGYETDIIHVKSPDKQDTRTGKFYDVSPRDLDLEEAPVTFGKTPINHQHQAYFTLFLKLDRMTLQEIARNQQAVLQNAADSPVRRIGRVVIHEHFKSDFSNLLNGLIISRMLEERKEPVIPVKELIGVRFERTVYANSEYLSIKLYTMQPKRWSNYARHFLGKSSEQETADFFKTMGYGFVINNPPHGGGTNTFFKALADEIPDKKIIKAFPNFADLMEEHQFADLEEAQKDLEATAQPRSYLKVGVELVKPRGDKEKLHQEYLKISNRNFFRWRSEIRTSETADFSGQTEKIDSLTQYIQRASAYRDFYLDLWERQLVPEIHANSSITSARIEKLFEMGDNLTTDIENFSSDSLVEMPLEWRNLKKQKMDIKGGRAAEILFFYEKTIPLLYDPQRQVRFGATAYRIWRINNMRASFSQELEIIEKFFPKPSKIRDGVLNGLYNRFEVPGPGVLGSEVLRAQKMYSAFHELEFDEEMSNADAGIQTVKSVLSAATRRDRKAVVLWILDSKKFPMPEIFQEARRQRNIMFDQLPDHSRYAPDFLRHELTNSIMTGENGLLNARTEDDLTVKKEFAAEVFDQFFPRQENVPSKTGISRDDLVLIRDIFVEAIGYFDQARGTVIIQGLLDMRKKLSQLSFGDRLTTLLAQFGPVGVKLGQFLSENEALVKNADLRARLASLKDDSNPFEKMVIVESLLLQGYPVSAFRVGKRIGAASMKQVHKGAVKDQNGVWRKVVIKELRPVLARTVDHELEVLEKVFQNKSILKRLQQRLPDFEPSQVISTIDRAIEQESVLTQEAQNTKDLQAVLENDPDIANYAHAGLGIRTPRVLKSSATTIIEEEVAGIELGRAMKLSPEVLISELKLRGISQAEIDKILAMDWNEVKRMIRKNLLSQIFKKGIFHADPHGSNLMLTGKDIVYIDAGLVGRLNNGQRESAKKLVRAILLGNAKGTLRFIEEILKKNGGNIHDRDRALKDIRNALTRNSQDLGQLLNQLGTIIVKHASHKGSENVSRLIKAISQGLWFLPMDRANGEETLKDLAEAIGLSVKDQTMIKLGMVIPGFKNFSIVNLIRKAFSAGIGAIKKLISKLFNLKQDIQEELSAKELMEQTQASLKQQAESSVEIPAGGERQYIGESERRVLGIAMDMSTGDTLNISVENDNLESLGLTAQQAENAMRVFIRAGKVVDFIKKEEYRTGEYGAEDATIPWLNEEQLNIAFSMLFAHGFVQGQSKKDVEDFIIQVELTRRYLLQQEERSPQAAWAKKIAAHLEFQDGPLRHITQTLIDQFFEQAEILDRLMPVRNVKTDGPKNRKELLVNLFNKAPDHLRPNEYHYFLHSELLVYKKTSAQANAYKISKTKKSLSPAFLQKLSNVLSSYVDITKPGIYATAAVPYGKEKAYAGVSVVRHFYSSDPSAKTIEVLVSGYEKNQVIRMELTDLQYLNFVQTPENVPPYEVLEYTPARAEIRSNLTSASGAREVSLGTLLGDDFLAMDTDFWHLWNLAEAAQSARYLRHLILHESGENLKLSREMADDLKGRWNDIRHGALQISNPQPSPEILNLTALTLEKLPAFLAANGAISNQNFEAMEGKISKWREAPGGIKGMLRQIYGFNGFLFPSEDFGKERIKNIIYHEALHVPLRFLDRRETVVAVRAYLEFLKLPEKRKALTDFFGSNQTYGPGVANDIAILDGGLDLRNFQDLYDGVRNKKIQFWDEFWVQIFYPSEIHPETQQAAQVFRDAVADMRRQSKPFDKTLKEIEKIKTEKSDPQAQKLNAAAEIYAREGAGQFEDATVDKMSRNSKITAETPFPPSIGERLVDLAGLNPNDGIVETVNKLKKAFEQMRSQESWMLSYIFNFETASNDEIAFYTDFDNFRVPADRTEQLKVVFDEIFSGRSEVRTMESEAERKGRGGSEKSGWLAEELGLSQEVLQRKLESPEIKWNMTKLNAALRKEFPGRVPYIKQINGAVGMAFAIGFEKLYRQKIEESFDSSFGFVGWTAEKVGLPEIALPGVYSKLTLQQDGNEKTLEDIPLTPGRLLPLIAERIKTFKFTEIHKQQTAGRPNWVYTLSQTLEKNAASDTEKTPLVRAHILEWLRTADTEKKTWSLPLLREQLLEVFPELNLSKFDYGLLLWELDLQDAFEEEYESRADRFAGSLADVGASFGINRGNTTRTMKVIRGKIAGIRKRGKEDDEESFKPRRAGQVDLNQIRILEALSGEKGERVESEDILAELNAPDLDWNLPEFFKRHPSIGWLKSRGYEVFFKGAGLEAAAREKMRERYEYYGGVFTAASQSFGLGNQVGRDFYEAMGFPPKLLSVRRGNLLKTFGVTKDEMLDRMVRSQWKDLPQLRDELVSKFNASQKERQKPELPNDKKKFGNADIIWGLDLADEFLAELKKRQDEGKFNYEIARSFGFEGSKSSVSTNFSGILRQVKTRLKNEKSLPVLFDGRDLQIILERFVSKYPYGIVRVLRPDNVWQTLRSPAAYSGKDSFVTSTKGSIRQLAPFPYSWSMQEDLLKIETLKPEIESPEDLAELAAPKLPQEKEKSDEEFFDERAEIRTAQTDDREDYAVGRLPLHRRSFLRLAVTAAALMLSGHGQKPEVSLPSFDFVRRRAEELSRKNFEPQVVRPSRELDYPAYDYNTENAVQPAEIMNEKGTGAVLYPRRGTLRQKLRVFNETSSGFREVEFSPFAVEYPAVDAQGRKRPWAFPAHTQHWTQASFFTQLGQGYPQYASFFANGYYRMASLGSSEVAGTVYGASSRPFVQLGDLGEINGRDHFFPELREIYIRKPSPNRQIIYQIFESPDAVMVQQLEFTVGAETQVTVSGEILPREGHSISAGQNMGFGFSSMYWRGPEEGFDQGNAAYDSNTVTAVLADGEEITHNIHSPPQGRKPFVREFGSEENPARSWTLESRYENAGQFIPNVHYPDRTSFEVSDMKYQVDGQDIPLQMKLIVMRPDYEYRDNVVAAAVLKPSAPIPSGKKITFSYQQTAKRAVTRSEIRSAEEKAALKEKLESTLNQPVIDVAGLFSAPGTRNEIRSNFEQGRDRFFDGEESVLSYLKERITLGDDNPAFQRAIDQIEKIHSIAESYDADREHSERDTLYRLVPAGMEFLNALEAAGGILQEMEDEIRNLYAAYAQMLGLNTYGSSALRVAFPNQFPPLVNEVRRLLNVPEQTSPQNVQREIEDIIQNKNFVKLVIPQTETPNTVWTEFFIYPAQKRILIARKSILSFEQNVTFVRSLDLKMENPETPEALLKYGEIHMAGTPQENYPLDKQKTLHLTDDTRAAPFENAQAAQIEFRGILGEELLLLNQLGGLLYDDERISTEDSPSLIGLIKKAADFVEKMKTEAEQAVKERSEIRTVRSIRKEDIPVITANDQLSHIIEPIEVSSAPVYNIARSELLDAEIDLIAGRSWRFSGKTPGEIAALLRDRLDNFQPDFQARIKKIITEEAFPGRFDESDITALASFGSFWYEEDPESAISDLDIIVVVKKPGIQVLDKKVTIPPGTIFKADAKRKPGTLQFLIFSEDYFLDRDKLKTSPVKISPHMNFETMLYGGGIILEGKDYWKTPPPVLNLAASVYQLILGSKLYLQMFRNYPRPGKLPKIKRRFEEASRILERIAKDAAGPQTASEIVFMGNLRQKSTVIFAKLKAGEINYDEFTDEITRLIGSLEDFLKSGYVKDQIAKDLQARLDQGQELLMDFPVRKELRIISKDGLPSEKDLQHGTGILYRITREKYIALSRLFSGKVGREMLPRLQEVLESLIRDKDKVDAERETFLNTFSVQELQDLTLRPFLVYPYEAEDTKAVIGGGKPSAYIHIKNARAFKKWASRNRSLLEKSGLGITKIRLEEKRKTVFYYNYALINQIFQDKIAANPVYGKILKTIGLTGKTSLSNAEIDRLMDNALGPYFNTFSGVLLGYGTSDPVVSERSALLGLTVFADYLEVPRDVLQPFDAFLVYPDDIIESFKSAGRMKVGQNTFNASESRKEIRTLRPIEKAMRDTLGGKTARAYSYSDSVQGDVEEELKKLIDAAPKDKPMTVLGAGNLSGIPVEYALEKGIPSIILVDIAPAVTRSTLERKNLQNDPRISVLEADVSMISPEFLDAVDHAIDAAQNKEQAFDNLAGVMRQFTENGFTAIQAPEGMTAQNQGLVISVFLENNLYPTLIDGIEKRIYEKFQFSLNNYLEQDRGMRQFDEVYPHAEDYLDARKNLHMQLKLLSAHIELMKTLMDPQEGRGYFVSIPFSVSTVNLFHAALQKPSLFAFHNLISQGGSVEDPDSLRRAIQGLDNQDQRRYLSPVTGSESLFYDDPQSLVQSVFEISPSQIWLFPEQRDLPRTVVLQSVVLKPRAEIRTSFDDGGSSKNSRLSQQLRNWIEEMKRLEPEIARLVDQMQEMNDKVQSGNFWEQAPWDENEAASDYLMRMKQTAGELYRRSDEMQRQSVRILESILTAEKTPSSAALIREADYRDGTIESYWKVNLSAEKRILKNISILETQIESQYEEKRKALKVVIKALLDLLQYIEKNQTFDDEFQDYINIPYVKQSGLSSKDLSKLFSLYRSLDALRKYTKSDAERYAIKILMERVSPILMRNGYFGEHYIDFYRLAYQYKDMPGVEQLKWSNLIKKFSGFRLLNFAIPAETLQTLQNTILGNITNLEKRYGVKFSFLNEGIEIRIVDFEIFDAAIERGDVFALFDMGEEGEAVEAGDTEFAKRELLISNLQMFYSMLRAAHGFVQFMLQRIDERDHFKNLMRTLRLSEGIPYKQIGADFIVDEENLLQERKNQPVPFHGTPSVESPLENIIKEHNRHELESILNRILRNVTYSLDNPDTTDLQETRVSFMQLKETAELLSRYRPLKNEETEAMEEAERRLAEQEKEAEEEIQAHRYEALISAGQVSMALDASEPGGVELQLGSGTNVRIWYVSREGYYIQRDGGQRHGPLGADAHKILTIGKRDDKGQALKGPGHVYSLPPSAPVAIHQTEVDLDDGGRIAAVRIRNQAGHIFVKGMKYVPRNEIREAAPEISKIGYSKIAVIILDGAKDNEILEAAGFIRAEVEKSGLQEVSDRIYREAEALIQDRAAEEMKTMLTDQTKKIKRQQENALAAIKWLTASLASANLGDGSVAVAFHAPGKESILKQALEQIIGGNQIIALLSSETQAEGLNVRARKAGKASHFRPQRYLGPGMVAENDKLLPMIQIVPAAEANSNPNVLSVDSMSTAESKEYGAFTSVVDAVARIVFSVVIGKRVTTVAELNKPGAFDRLLASLLKEEPGKIAALRQQYPDLNNLFKLEGNRLQINTAALDIITQYRASQNVKRAA